MKWLLTFGYAAALACLVVARAEAADSAAVAAEGKRLALTTCAACHMVSADQPKPPTLEPRAPSFVSIANDPRMTPAYLRQFVMAVHKTLKSPPDMPTMILSDNQALTVVYYLVSLKKTP